jgi:Glycogen recognition site of AMP-activated protein kinase
MHPDVHRYLDGELARDALSPEGEAELRDWEALMAELAFSRAARAPAALADRVMAMLPGAAAAPNADAPAAWRRALDWLLRPRSVRLRPVTLLAAAAAFVLLVLVAPFPRRPVAPPAGPGSLRAAAPVPSAQPQEVYVQFIYQGGPGVVSVAVAGDFNGWSPADYPLQDTDRDGVWSAMFPVPMGLHKYMFVVNGKTWVTDPRAERHVDDGFGMKNAIISVGPLPGGRTS